MSRKCFFSRCALAYRVVMPRWERVENVFLSRYELAYCVAMPRCERVENVFLSCCALAYKAPLSKKESSENIFLLLKATAHIFLLVVYITQLDLCLDHYSLDWKEGLTKLNKFVCLSVCLSVCLFVCLSVCHRVKRTLPGRTQTVIT